MFCIRFLTIFIVLSFIIIRGARSEENNNPPQPVGIVEHLGESVPEDVVLVNEFGQQVKVKDLINKPTIVSFVYFRCPGICTPLLNGLKDVVDKVDLQPGKDFNIITISIDPIEDYLIASEKKESYLSEMTREVPVDSWRFLTGDSVNVHKMSDALGFNFQRQGNDFMHGAGIMMISPEGKIVRYLYGTEFLPFDLKMAVIEGSEGRVGATIGKLMKFCFSYDPDGRKYALNVTRIAGGGVLLVLLIFAGVIIFKKKKQSRKTGNEV